MAERCGATDVGAMSSVEAVFCRSAPWRGFARGWCCRGCWRRRRAAGAATCWRSAAAAARWRRSCSTRHPDIRLTLADIDPAMAAAARRRLAPFGDRASVTVGDGTRLELRRRLVRHRLLVADAAPHDRLGGRAGRGGARDPARRAGRGLRPDRHRRRRARCTGWMGPSTGCSSARRAGARAARLGDRRPGGRAGAWRAPRCASARGPRERLHAHRAHRRARAEAPARATGRGAGRAAPRRAPSWRTRRPPARSAAG